MRLHVAILVLAAACGGSDPIGEPEPLVPAADGGVTAIDAPTEAPPAPADAAVPPSTPPGFDARVPSPALPPRRADAAPPRVDAAPPPPPKVDAAPPPPPPPKVDAAAPPPPDPEPVWSDAVKCENMCQSYCVHKYMCDGSDIGACRMAIDEADGGTCTQRAHLFSDLSQGQVEACISAIEEMSCRAFVYMFNTGDGVPKACVGIII
jgi:hypothetical protein